MDLTNSHIKELIGKADIKAFIYPFKDSLALKHPENVVRYVFIFPYHLIYVSIQINASLNIKTGHITLNI